MFSVDNNNVLTSQPVQGPLGGVFKTYFILCFYPRVKRFYTITHRSHI